MASLLMDMGAIAALCQSNTRRNPMGALDEIFNIALSNYHPGFPHELPDRYKPAETGN